MSVRVGPQAQTLPRPGRPVAPNAGYRADDPAGFVVSGRALCVVQGEAMAALLGHKSLPMTFVYVRIADRTLADEYFNVSQKVEAPSTRTAASRRQRRSCHATSPHRIPHDALQLVVCPANRVGLHLESICEASSYSNQHRVPALPPQTARPRRPSGPPSPRSTRRRVPRPRCRQVAC
jgi:hypothetical protein